MATGMALRRPPSHVCLYIMIGLLSAWNVMQMFRAPDVPEPRPCVVPPRFCRYGNDRDVKVLIGHVSFF